MSFSSVAFIVFLIAVFVAYYQIPHKFRYILLIFANFFFYGSLGSLYLFTVFYIAVAAYFIGIRFEQKVIKSGLIACTSALLVPLFMYKYLNFTIESVDRLLSLAAIPLRLSVIRLIFPIGVSFYTLEALSYVIDVYKGRIKAERNFFNLLIFISFFGTIVSGPIKRAGHFLPQLYEEKQFDYERAVRGFRLMLLGLFKKVVCADYLCVLADSVFDRVILFKGPVFIVAVIVYTYQIYLDFSGYTDIVRGFSYALGFNICENFKAPYLSKSIKEFFGRWHISFSSWLKDYIYIPLGGNRLGKLKKYRNLLITFLISGLWHGAGFTFIVWGLLHGIYQIAADFIHGIFSAKDKKIPVFITGAVTFVLVSFAWLFFRVNSLSEAVFVLKNTFAKSDLNAQMSQMGFTGVIVYIAVLVIIVFTVLLDVLSEKKDILTYFAGFKLPVRWAFYIVMLTFIITMRAHIGADASFIYSSF